MFIFLFIMTILIPLIMIIFGIVCKYYPPKKINDIYGYRTKNSMRSQEAWDFAYQFNGKLMLRWGMILLILSMIAMLCLKTYYEWVCMVVCIIQTVIVCFTIPPTEKALKEKFNK